MQGGSNDNGRYDFSMNKDNIWCAYCKKLQYTKETIGNFMVNHRVSTVLVVLNRDNSEAKCM